MQELLKKLMLTGLHAGLALTLSSSLVTSLHSADDDNRPVTYPVVIDTVPTYAGNKAEIENAFQGVAGDKPTAKQEAISFKNNDILNSRSGSGKIEFDSYVKNQEAYTKWVSEINAKTCAETGLKAEIQTGSRIRVGTDSDFLVRNPDGSPMTMEKIKLQIDTFNRNANEYFKNNGAAEWGSSNWAKKLDIDFMPDAKSMSKEEWSKFQAFAKEAGMHVYQSQEAANVEFVKRGNKQLSDNASEAKTNYEKAKGEGRTGDELAELKNAYEKANADFNSFKNNPQNQLTAHNLAEYVKECSNMAQDYQKSFRADSEMLNKLKNDLWTKNSNIVADTEGKMNIERAKFAKMIERVNTTTTELCEKLNIPKPESLNTEIMNQVNTAAKREAGEFEKPAANVAENSQKIFETSVKEFVNASAQGAAQNPAEAGKYQQAIAEAINGLPPKQQSEIINELAVRNGEKFVQGVTGEMAKLPPPPPPPEPGYIDKAKSTYAEVSKVGEFVDGKVQNFLKGRGVQAAPAGSTEKLHGTLKYAGYLMIGLQAIDITSDYIAGNIDGYGVAVRVGEMGYGLAYGMLEFAVIGAVLGPTVATGIAVYMTARDLTREFLYRTGLDKVVDKPVQDAFYNRWFGGDAAAEGPMLDEIRRQFLDAIAKGHQLADGMTPEQAWQKILQNLKNGGKIYVGVFSPHSVPGLPKFGTGTGKANVTDSTLTNTVSGTATATSKSEINTGINAQGAEIKDSTITNTVNAEIEAKDQSKVNVGVSVNNATVEDSTITNEVIGKKINAESGSTVNSGVKADNAGITGGTTIKNTIIGGKTDAKGKSKINEGVKFEKDPDE
ncbi:MAG TPA: hypothetical protein DET40_23560 [Lentisphaeria bacterium]|nr:MAG: hypothetical protein A2X45_23775 [Lentisphaerae bacterium GWF2_50_93]HCE46534.1 hypothetical protein [Lentisphaeria bacterium]